MLNLSPRQWKPATGAADGQSAGVGGSITSVGESALGACSLKCLFRWTLTSSSRINVVGWRQLEIYRRRNPLIVNRKSIPESVPVLGSSHPHPNHVKGVFSALHFFRIENRVFLGRNWSGGNAGITRAVMDRESIIYQITC